MAGIWVYSEDDIITKQMLTIGKVIAAQAQQPLCALTLAEDAAKTLIAAGAEKVYVLTGDNVWPESYAGTIAKLVDQHEPSALFIGATLRGKDLAAKVAAQLKTGLATDAFAIRYTDGRIETDRMMYGGLAVCTEVLSTPSLVTIPPRTFDEPLEELNRSGEIIHVSAEADTKVNVSAVCPIVRQGADITAAEAIVCVGRGLAKQDDLKLAQDLAALLDGAVGCTRSVAEDYHWLPAETYIGLSGQKVKPALYLSMGVSGQIQHVSGIRDSKVIAAVDMNENAPIFEAADYGIVGDLYEIIPLLTKEIEKIKQG